MYHISNDKRSRKSAELIWEGMEACLQNKSWDKLRITDICEKSYISRATFYRLFDSLQDVILYRCDCIYLQLAENMKNSVFRSRQEFFLYLIEKWIQQDVLIKTLVENNMIHIIYETHMKNRALMKELFLSNVTISDKDADYLLSVLVNLIPAALHVWYLHDKTETPEEILHAISQSLTIISQQLGN